MKIYCQWCKSKKVILERVYVNREGEKLQYYVCSNYKCKFTKYGQAIQIYKKAR